MNIEYSFDKITISCEAITKAEHEIEKVYLNQFRNAKVQIREDPRSGKICQLVMLPKAETDE